MTTIPATVTTPKIVLDTQNNLFSFEGESYPEDVNAFFDPIITPLKTHLNNLQDSDIQFDFFLTYFNSASTKVFFNLFALLEEISEFNSVTVNWKHHEEDDTAEEFGQEFKEDLDNVRFNFIAI
ncbi:MULTISPECIES: DUF1987 domain-containing protein [unclassified Sulfuricurvum]|uniref:DUF1987 domain-containing protein n=1 Tax=unclassified Sulfuricurvum TaxID=2632390 RepID=UPI00029978FD|nr:MULTISPECIES: DUF1987 domain-containing protein [unclassified Sulfuricurvum]OHD84767.1 MAG: hypothetical protein A3D90_01110 [Sulfuricurvum sp. RIFCSPHIGHO2_02_FULL_43_9]OHD85495.1 MAG: hypothetical protein A2Y52_04745 [Sulfuricurvum sp. RIFCSPLOWO2_02_43_6]OHD85579.1 MAG: hypothetical protein A3I60_00255 [Sulfuricurvum sp. RIFCSPLOWO2_02_FULL_43_45]OHD87297.1 MAG: hypothetical protein A3J39_01780 [Sulfuricurvum sp. RIFCSPHIGHO2_12_FULL_44_8]OHD92974.1 MAG: hypothetical protein A2W83_02770 